MALQLDRKSGPARGALEQLSSGGIWVLRFVTGWELA
jgi:hypothetical protein